MALAGVTLASGVGSATAQAIPREEYLRFVPLEVPRIVGQTEASALFRLYGDPTASDFTDAAPRDGVDDRRMALFETLGRRFAPYLVQTSEMVPLDFRAVSGGGGLPLHVDTWETAMSERLVASEEIRWLDDGAPTCESGDESGPDCRVLDLLRSYHPDGPAGATERGRAARPDTDPFELLWLDFPADGPRTWKRHYRDDEGRLRADLRDRVHTYLHPFLEEIPTDGPTPRYQLILQYWFFYPYNDGGNNHEGDWEHIHVIPAPRDRVTESGLTADEMEALLAGDWSDSGDQELVIKRVEYYFHSKVTTLDFSAPNAYVEEEGSNQGFVAERLELTGGDYWRRYVRYMAYQDDAETKVNTHPIGYIGADNKGLDQLLSPPGGMNRDSHGTYPAPGLFKDIGPAGATEDVHPSFDHRAFFAASANQRREMTAFARGDVVFLGEPGMIEVVPDYEPVIDLVMSDVGARRRWSWFLLPIRWGYPATESPLAGIVSHAETGNVSIVGPAFNTGWNRSGENQQYETYDPHVLPRLFPTSLQDAFSNDLGFLNATVPTLSFFPPFDALWRVLAAPVRAALTPLDRVFYPSETVPYRFIGLRAGVATHFIDDAYTDLLFNEVQGPEVIARLAEHLVAAGPTTSVTGETQVSENQFSPVYLLDLFVGRHLISTNGLRHGRSRVGSSIMLSDLPPLTIDSDLNMWEYTGSLRYSVLTEAVQPFVRLGYGLSWYRLENVSTNGVPLETPDSEWIRQPSIPKLDHLLPNTWHFGLGVELVPIRRFDALPSGLDLGVTLEWQHFTNKLGLDALGLDIQDLVFLGVDPHDLPQERWVGRHAFSASVSVSF